MPRLQPGAHHVAGQHPVDREVLADVAQEVDRRQLAGPVEVVDQSRRVVALEGRGTARAGADPLHPALDHLGRVERALAGLLGVADLPGGAADQQQRRVAGELQPAGGERSAPGCPCAGSARSGRSRHRSGRPAVELLAQLVEVGGVLDQAAPLQVVDQGVPPGRRGAAVGHGNDSPPWTGDGPYRVCRVGRGVGWRAADRGGTPWRCRI